MKCLSCGSEMNPTSSYNYDEVFGEGKGIVSYFRCINEKCNAEIEFSKKDIEEEEKQ